jgi:hypothetical protein
MYYVLLKSIKWIVDKRPNERKIVINDSNSVNSIKTAKSKLCECIEYATCALIHTNAYCVFRLETVCLMRPINSDGNTTR